MASTICGQHRRAAGRGPCPRARAARRRGRARRCAAPPVGVTSGSASPWTTRVGTSSAAQAVGPARRRRGWRAAGGPRPPGGSSGRRPRSASARATVLVEVVRAADQPAASRRRGAIGLVARSAAGGCSRRLHGLGVGLADLGLAGGRHDRGERAHPRRGARWPSSGRSSRPSTRRRRGRESMPRWSSSADGVGGHVGELVRRRRPARPAGAARNVAEEVDARRRRSWWSRPTSRLS